MGGGGGAGVRVSSSTEHKDICYILSYIKFKGPSSSSSPVLNQTKGVTDKKGTCLPQYFTEFSQNIISCSKH